MKREVIKRTARLDQKGKTTTRSALGIFCTALKEQSQTEKLQCEEICSIYKRFFVFYTLFPAQEQQRMLHFVLLE